MPMKYGKTHKMAKSNEVEIVVREMTYTDNTGKPLREFVEIREWIKPTSVYGHGVVIPINLAPYVSTYLMGLWDAHEKREAEALWGKK